MTSLPDAKTFDSGVSMNWFVEDYEKDFVDEFGQEWKKYRDFWDRCCSLKEESKFPPHMEIELNYSCNLRCPMCTWSAETEIEKKSDWLKFEDYEKLLQEAVSLGTKSIRLCYVNEPLIRQDIDEFIKCAKNLGILDIIITTNGTLMTKEVSKKLINAGLTKLNVSLDAFTEETYDKMRVGGDFNVTKKNILDFIEVRNELKKKIPKVKVSFVQTKINQDEFDNFVNFWSDKVDGISIQNLQNPFENGKFKDSSKKELLELDEKSKAPEKFCCPEPFKRITIRGTGDVIGCCSLAASDLVVGNWKNEKIAKIWNGDKMKKLQKIHKEGRYFENPICKSCVENQFFNVD